MSLRVEMCDEGRGVVVLASKGPSVGGERVRGGYGWCWRWISIADRGGEGMAVDMLSNDIAGMLLIVMTLWDEETI
jgi:hypothetical protein